MVDPKLDLTRTDEAIDIGHKVLGMLAEGYDGEQIGRALDVNAGWASYCLGAYAGRVLLGKVPPYPSPECGDGPSYDGWCYVHGVYHPEPGVTHRPGPPAGPVTGTAGA